MKKNILYRSFLIAFLLLISSSLSAYNWTPVSSGIYENSMVIYGDIRVNGNALANQEKYEIGVFCGTECRALVGAGKTTSGRIYFPLTIPGNDGDKLTFVTRPTGSTNTAEEKLITQTVVFKQNDKIQNFIFTIAVEVKIETVGNVASVYASPIGSGDGGSSNPAEFQQAYAALAKSAAPEKKLYCASGIYYLNEPLALQEGVSILRDQNVNPASAVIFDARGVNRVFEVPSLKGIGADRISRVGTAVTPTVRIEGITFKNGRAQKSTTDGGNGGALLLSPNVLVSNCIFIDNSADNNGGAVYGGQIEKSLFIGNSATIGGDALCNAVIDHATIVRNKGLQSVLLDCTLTNSVVWGNKNNNLNGCTISYAAIEGVTSANGINLATDNGVDDNANNRLAPRFASVEVGKEDWTPATFSPLVKMTEASTDFGVIQSNQKKLLISHLSTAVPVVTYGDLPDCKVSFTDALGNPVTSITPQYTFSYKATTASTWSTAPPTVVGKYDVKVDVLSTGDWETDPSRAAQTISFEITPRPLIVYADNIVTYYGEPEQPLTYKIAEGYKMVAGDNPSGSLIRELAGEKNARSYAITQGTLVFGDNYKVTFKQGSYLINKRPLLINAENKSQTYGEPIVPLTYTTALPANATALGLSGSPLVQGDSFVGELTRGTDTNVGNYAIIQGTFSTNNTNYAITYTPATYSIAKREITIAANMITQVYGDTKTPITYSISQGTLLTGDQLGGTLDRETPEIKAVGAYKILLNNLTVQGKSDNYLITLLSNDATYSITPRPISITAEAKNTTYGEPKFPLTYVLSGKLAAWDNFVGELQVENWNAGTRNIMQGTLTIGGITNNPNYTITYVPASLTVAKRNLTVASKNYEKTYGNATPIFKAVENIEIRSGSLAAEDAFAGNFVRVNPSDESAKTFPNELKRNDDFDIVSKTSPIVSKMANYELVFVAGNFTINKRDIKITANKLERYYGEPEGTITYAQEGLSTDDQLTLTLTRENVTANNVGNYNIIKSTMDIQHNLVSVLSNYTVTFVPDQYIIKKRPIVVTPRAQSRQYFEANPLFTYDYAFPTSQEGLTGEVKLAADNFTGALSRTDITNENVGNYPITLGSLAINDNYDIRLSATPVNFTISPRKITLNVDAAQQVYGEKDTPIVYRVSGANLANNDSFEGALSRVDYVNKGIGDYAIIIGSLKVKNNNANYEITLNDNSGSNKYSITKRPITLVADSKTMVYGDQKPVLTYAVTVGSYAYSERPTGELLQDILTVGTHTIKQGSLALTDNYNLTFTTADFVVTQRNIQVSIIDSKKEYGSPNPTFVHNIISGTLAAGDQFSGGFQRQSNLEDVAVYPNDLIVKDFTINNANGVSVIGNYKLTVNKGNYEITKRQLRIVAQAVSVYYGEPLPSLTYTTTGLLSGDKMEGSLVRELPNSSNVGIYKIMQGDLTVGGNYLVTYVGANYEIKKRPVVLTADKKEIFYFEILPDLTYTLHLPAETTGLTGSALVSGDVIAGSLQCAGYTSRLDNAGFYDIRLGTINFAEKSPNYQLTYEAAKLEIKKIPLTIKAIANQKIYGGEDPAFAYQLVGALVNNDRFEGALQRANKLVQNAGVYTNDIVIGNFTVANNARNYAITYQSADFTILTRSIDVIIESMAKNFGERDPNNFSYRIVSGELVAGDRFDGNPIREAGENAGIYKIKKGSLALTANYQLSVAEGEMQIKAIPLSVKAKLKTKIYGDADPILDYEIIGAMPSGEKLSGKLSRGIGENVGTYVIEQGTLAASKNFVFAYEPANLTITRRPIVVHAENQEKIYKEKDPRFTYNIAGLGLVGSDKATGFLQRTEGENVGTYAIAQGTLQFSNNYEVTQFNPAKLQINKATAQFEVEELSQFFDRKAKQAEISTYPRELKYKVTYEGIADLPIKIGTYELRIVIEEPNYEGEYIGEFKIEEPEVKTIQTTTAISKSSGDASFKMMYEELMDNTRLQFFNSRGGIIFDKYDYRSGDFNFSGQPAGTYYYVFTYKDSKGIEHIQKGFVEVLP